MKIDVTVYVKTQTENAANMTVGLSWPDRGSETVKKTSTDERVVQNVKDVGTSWEQVDFGALATTGYLGIAHIDGTDTLEVALDNLGAKYVFAKLKPGDVAIFPAAGTNVYVRSAGTGTVKINQMALPEHS